jgi:hypothetical protein
LRRCHCVATVAILVAATLVVVVATAIATVAAASWTSRFKSTPVLADGARMGGSEISGGGCDCGCSGDNGGNDDEEGGSSNGKNNGDGNRCSLMTPW